MSILQLSKKIFALFLICTSLQLTGCKVAAEIGEGLFHFLAKITAKFIENSIFDQDKNPPNTVQKNTDTLPFTLFEGETYQKVNNNQNQLDYYAVQRRNGSTEHYSIDGELLWSSLENGLTDHQTTDEYLGIDFSTLETNEETLEAHTHKSSITK